MKSLFCFQRFLYTGFPGRALFSFYSECPDFRMAHAEGDFFVIEIKYLQRLLVFSKNEFGPDRVECPLK